MQCDASESSVLGLEGAAPLSMPKNTARFGRSFAKDAVREQSAFKQSVAPGAPFIPSRIFSRVCVTSP